MKNSLIIRLSSGLSLLCALASHNASAQGFEQNSSFNFGQEAFLPTEEAFQVVPSLDRHTVRLHWTIADKYYLYKHKFSLSAQSPDKSITLELALPEGKMKYDEAFDKELEVYYQFTTLQTSLPKWEGDIELKLTSQGCAEAGLCYPPRKQYFSVSREGIIETNQPRFSKPSNVP